MSAEQGSNTEATMVVYVRLRNEGTTVYRPVEAAAMRDGIFLLGGFDCYDPDDEEWEFVPGQKVFAEARLLGDERVLVATASLD